MEGPGASEERRPEAAGRAEPRALRDRIDALARLARRRVQRAPKGGERRDERTLHLAQAEHRINTTLALIEGWARTLQQHWESLAPDTRENGLATIRRRALDAREEVEGLLLDARSRMAEVETSSARIDVSRVLGQMVSAYRGATARSGVSFVGHSPLYAWVDLPSLNQVCSILIDNAVTSSPPGDEVTVCASARDGNLVIEVVDQGLGVPAGVDAFALSGRRTAATIHPVGLGLGLHTARALVRSMGGEVGYHRNERRGSTFEVVLPLDPRPRVPTSN
jgi:signal transduction histidine kinase